MLREEGLGEVQEGSDRGGDFARGGLGDLAEDELERAEDVERLGGGRLRALLSRLGAGGAVHVLELASGFAWGAEGLHGDGGERATGGVRGGGAAKRSKRLGDGGCGLLAHLGSAVRAEVADGAERLGAVRPLLVHDGVAGGIAERRDKEADAVDHAAQSVRRVLRCATQRQEHLHRRRKAGQHGRGRGVLQRGAEHGEHRTRPFGRAGDVLALERRHNRREHRSRGGRDALLAQDVRHRLEHRRHLSRLGLLGATVPAVQLRHGIAHFETGEFNRHDGRSVRRVAEASAAFARVRLTRSRRRRCMRKASERGAVGGSRNRSLITCDDINMGLKSL